MTKQLDDILVKDITTDVFWELLKIKMNRFFDAINQDLFREFVNNKKAGKDSKQKRDALLREAEKKFDQKRMQFMQFLQTTLQDSFKIEFTFVTNYITKMLITVMVLLVALAYYEQHYHVFFEERRNNVKTLLRLYAGGAAEHRFTYAYYAHWFWSYP